MDNDIVQGAEDQGIQEEEGGGETSYMMNILIKLLVIYTINSELYVYLHIGFSCYALWQ